MKRRIQAEKQHHDALYMRILTVCLPTFAALFTAALIAVSVSFLFIRPFVTIELGEPSPGAQAFLKIASDDASFAVEPPERCREAGDYWVKVRCAWFARAAILRVRDTVAPTADAVEVTVSTKETLTPDRLVTNLKDQSILKLTYVKEPDYGTVGDYEAVIRIEDKSGNRTELTVPVHVRIARESVAVEAGAPAPAASDFLLDDYDAKLLTEVTETLLRTPGDYPIRISADGSEVESVLRVTDTVPPQAVAKTFVAAPDAKVVPEDLISDVCDETAVTASFVNEPDPALREPQTVSVQLTDLGGNKTIVNAELLFSGVSPIRIEASGEALCAEELPLTGSGTASIREPFVPNEIGMHLVPVEIDGQENLAAVEVQDTVAPKLTVTVDVWYLNARKDAEFFAAAEDATETTLAFLQEPDWTLETQQVTVTAIDAGGNRAETTFTLTLEADSQPPVLYGARDRFCYRDEAVAYLLDVFAEDDCDGTVEVHVDTSAVDPQKVGVYPVTYTAADRAGNTVEKTVRFSVVEPKVTEEEAETVAREILSEILTDDMTIYEQIEAIYNYVFRNVHYVGRSDKTDWRSEAVRGLTTGKGDCFTSYSSARLLMEHTDAEIMSVERYGGSTRHYWLLVNVGSGWYHFDVCNAGPGKKRCFMWTNEQTNAVSHHFWRYNQSLYPPVATERYNGGK